MARPKKQTAEWFPHYVMDSRTKFILEDKWGNDGYAFWFKLLEVLCKRDGHYLDCSDMMNLKYFIAITRVKESVALEILNELADIGKIDRELWRRQNVIWCQGLVDNIASMYSKRTDDAPQKPALNNEFERVLAPETTENEGFRSGNSKKEGFHGVSGSGNRHSTVQYNTVQYSTEQNSTHIYPREDDESNFPLGDKGQELHVGGNEPNVDTQHTSDKQSNADCQHTHDDQPNADTQGSKKKQSKTKYADFVSMTNDEYQSLIDRFGEGKTKRCIEILDNYKGSVGKRYKSDFRTILGWVSDKYDEDQRIKGTKNKKGGVPDDTNPLEGFKGPESVDWL